MCFSLRSPGGENIVTAPQIPFNATSVQDSFTYSSVTSRGLPRSTKEELSVNVGRCNVTATANVSQPAMAIASGIGRKRMCDILLSSILTIVPAGGEKAQLRAGAILGFG